MKRLMQPILCFLVASLLWAQSVPPKVAFAAEVPAAVEPVLYLPSISAVDSSRPSVTYDVKYREHTHVIDDAVLDAQLLSVSEDKSEYRFRTPTPSVSQLKAGDVVIFAGLALRKVVSVNTSGNEIIVKTEESALDEAIAEGTIGWRYPVDWANLPQDSYAAMQIGAAGSDFRLVEAKGFDANGKLENVAAIPPELVYTGIINGWEVVLKFKPAADRLNIEVTAKRNLGSSLTAISATGFISTFTQESLIDLNESSLRQVTVESKGLAGEMELKWASAAPDGGLTGPIFLQIPLEIPIPLRVGPIPVTVKIKTIVQIVPEMMVAQASSGGSWKATFRSDQGFSFANNTATATGGLHNASMDTSGDTVSAGFGSVGFGLGVEFPRVEVSIFEVVSAFITVKTYSSSIFEIEPPCQKGFTQIAAVAGFSLKVFSLSLGTGQKELWKERVDKYKDGKVC